jgi:NB-ARC domain
VLHSSSPKSLPADATPNYDLGLRLGNAPQINEEDFVGREDELTKLQTWLAPRPKRQNIVALCGLGGMGKTQLSVHFARQSADTYSSILWFSAKDESTLKAGMAALAAEATEEYSARDAHEEERMVQQARQWLSRPGNDRWLLVYDNYDDPRLPGIDSSTGFDVRQFFPQRAQGSILITTRSPRLSFAKQLRLQKLDNIKQSLTILATRSGREINGGEESCTYRRMLSVTDYLAI